MTDELRAQDARDLTDRIKGTVEWPWDLVKQAYRSGAWAALGYVSWGEYCMCELATRRPVPRQARAVVVASLRESGMSTRAIAAATGMGLASVHRRLTSDVPNGTPGTSSDAHPSQELRKPPRTSLPDSFWRGAVKVRKDAERLTRLAEDDRFERNSGLISERSLADLTRSRDALQCVINRLTPQEFTNGR